MVFLKVATFFETFCHMLNNPRRPIQIKWIIIGSKLPFFLSFSFFYHVNEEDLATTILSLTKTYQFHNGPIGLLVVKMIGRFALLKCLQILCQMT
jgi:hypothetical protein